MSFQGTNFITAALGLPLFVDSQGEAEINFNDAIEILDLLSGPVWLRVHSDITTRKAKYGDAYWLTADYAFAGQPSSWRGRKNVIALKGHERWIFIEPPVGMRAVLPNGPPITTWALSTFDKNGAWAIDATISAGDPSFPSTIENRPSKTFRSGGWWLDVRSPSTNIGRYVETLLRIESIIQPVCETTQATPPTLSTSIHGNMYWIAASPTGSWVGRMNDLAIAYAPGAGYTTKWLFIEPFPGLTFRLKTTNNERMWNNTAWTTVTRT
jgi:hypothetical protein